ncbi:MAG: hypothetical protein IPJ71_11650 [Bdellovibrionales bacterium]|nr:hypothetical protein [Bdellovibrionales bacterium]
MISIVANAATVQSSLYFDIKQEFPNYFLPAAFREGPPESVPPAVVDQSRRQLERTLTSIFGRLLVPVVGSDGKLSNVRYFDFLRSQVDQRVSVMPSGGVVRSAIGYVYARLYNQLQQDAKQNPLKILEEIAKELKDIPGYEIRGVGSDFDILVDGPKDLLAESIQKIQAITNSAINQFESNGQRTTHVAQRSVFTIGDVKVYGDQITLSTNQGGSTVDFLAFDLTKGVFVEPKNHRYIVDDLIKGTYRYIAPSEPLRDADKQTVRGLRPLLELPFLMVLDETQLREELETIKRKIESSGAISEKALLQIEKTIRNARYSGAHNRIFRAAPNTLESLILDINDRLVKRGLPAIPEFADHFNIGLRDPNLKLELNGIDPSLLTPVEQFIDSLPKGVLFHGTASVEQAMSILRKGFFLSGGHNRQGRSVYGTGAYTSPSGQTAESYAGENGMVLDLHIKRDQRINILDANQLSNHPGLKVIKANADRRKLDFHQVLAREHGIDILVTGHVLILNSDAVDIADGLETLIRGLYFRMVHSQGKDIAESVTSYLEYQRLFPYAVAAGLTSLTPPENPIAFLSRVKPDIVSGLAEIETLKRRKYEFIQKVHNEQEEIFSNPQVSGRGYPPSSTDVDNLIDQVTPMLNTMALRKTANTLMLASRKKDQLMKLLHLIAESQPLAFVKIFPEIFAFRFDRTSINITNDNMTIKPNANGIELLLFQLFQKARSGIAFGPDEQVLIQYLIRHHQSDVIRVLLAISSHDQFKRILALIKSSEQDGYQILGALFRLDHFGFKLANTLANSGNQKVLNELRAEIGKNREYRGKFMKFVLSSSLELSSFPWDLRTGDDLKAMRSVYQSVEQAESHYMNVLHRIHAQYKFTAKNGLQIEADSIDEAYIKDAALRHEFSEARIQFHRSQGISKILDDLQNHKKVMGKPIDLSSEEARRLEQKYAKGGRTLRVFDGKEAALIRKFVGSPVLGYNYDIYRVLFFAEGPLTQLLMGRFERFLPTDDPNVLVQVLKFAKTNRPDGAREQIQRIEAILHRPEIQAAAIAKGSIRDYPWDLNRDRQVLDSLIESVPSEDALDKMVYQFFNDLYQSQPELVVVPQQEYSHPLFIKSSKIDSKILGVLKSKVKDIYDSNLRHRARLILTLSDQVGSLKLALFDLEGKDPLSFFKVFPKLGGMNFQLDKLIATDKSLVLNSEQFKYEKSSLNLHQLFVSLLGKLKAGHPLQNADRAFIDYMIQRGETSAWCFGAPIGLLLVSGNQGHQDYIFSRLKHYAGIGDRILMQLLSDQIGYFPAYNKEADRIYLLELRERIKSLTRSTLYTENTWRDQVRDRIFATAEDWGWKEFQNFPWDLRKPKDVMTLRKMIVDSETATSVLIDILGELRRDQGFKPPNGLISNAKKINPEAILNPQRRLRFIAALTKYEIQERIKDLLVRLGSSLAQVKPAAFTNAVVAPTAASNRERFAKFESQCQKLLQNAPSSAKSR